MDTIYFFIGTIAELIKIMPVMKELHKKNAPFKIIASGQNNILTSELLDILHIKRQDIIVLSDKPIKQSSIGLLIWFIKTFWKSLFIVKKNVKSPRKNSYMIVHGDTVSTLMGALVGRCLGMKVGHVEAGLRSFNFLHPFPEEIDRVLVSRLAHVHFCPNKWAVNNLKNIKGHKINTIQNTLVNSLSIAIKQRKKTEILKRLENKEYFVFVLHRQENLFNKELVSFLIDEIQKISQSIHCLFVLHEPTRITLERLGLMSQLKASSQIILSPRLGYMEFMKVLDGCRYMITDGGSNQEEAYYLGKPCLILRKATERIEGLDQNVVLSKLNPEIIQQFIQTYKQYERPKIEPQESPSVIIANYITT